MALDPSVIDALVASGCTVEQLAAAVKADAILDKEKLLERRYQATIRKRNQRQRHRDNMGQSVTPPLPPCPPSPSDKERSPTPPKEINSPSPLNPPSPQIFVQFDEFWPLYPRKEAKRDALKAWGQQIKSGISPDTILNGLRTYRFPEDPTFCPLPASWLRGHRWEDQPATVVYKLSTKPKDERKEAWNDIYRSLDNLGQNGTQGSRTLGSSATQAVSSGSAPHVRNGRGNGHAGLPTLPGDSEQDFFS